MGTTVKGMTGVGFQSAMSGTVAVGNSNRNSRISGIRSGGKNTTPKKKLNYNPRDISGQLLRAKKVQNASIVLTRAKAKVALLTRQGATGQYSEREVANALIHARSMVHCSQMKVRHLRMEEQEHKSYETKNGAKELQRKGEVRRRVAAKERQLESKIAAKELQEVTRQKREYNELMQKQRMHRSKEQAKINEADMKYIKGMLEQNRDSGNSTVRSEAILSLSTHAAAIAELQRLEMECQQLEQQAEAEVSAETAADVSGGAETAAMPAGEVASAEAAPVPEAAVAVSVDAAV